MFYSHAQLLFVVVVVVVIDRILKGRAEPEYLFWKHKFSAKQISFLAVKRRRRGGGGDETPGGV